MKVLHDWSIGRSLHCLDNDQSLVKITLSRRPTQDVKYISHFIVTLTLLGGGFGVVGGCGADGKFWHIVPEQQTTVMTYPINPPLR